MAADLTGGDVPGAAAQRLPLDAQAIMRALPHRYPILLVDRVLECVDGSHIAGFKNVCRGEAMMRPGGDATMPHLLVIEALAQLAVILSYRTLGRDPSSGDLAFFAGIDDARFGYGPRPGDRIDLNARVMKIRRGIGRFAGRASVGDELVCDVQMVAAWRAA